MTAWKPEPTIISTISRLDAIELCLKISRAMGEERWADMYRLAGITDQIAEDLTSEELNQTFAVRIQALTNRAGMKHIDWNNV